MAQVFHDVPLRGAAAANPLSEMTWISVEVCEADSKVGLRGERRSGMMAAKAMHERQATQQGGGGRARDQVGNGGRARPRSCNSPRFYANRTNRPDDASAVEILK